MPFDPTEYGLEPDPTDGQSVQMDPGVLTQAITNAVVVSPYARRMSAVEEKLTIAAYYKSVLDMDFFDGRDTFTVRIETEIKDFVVKRIEALLNNEPSQPREDAFTPEEIKVLKLWAKKLLAPKPPPLATSVQPVAAPVVAPVAAPPPVTKRRRAAMPGAKPVAKAESGVAPEPVHVSEPGNRRGRKPQARSAGALPMPQGHAFTAASEMQARQQIMSNPNIQALGEHISSIKE